MPVFQQTRREASRFASLLELDPDLGDLLGGDRAVAAHRELQVMVVDLPAGSWRPAAVLPPSRPSVGLLIVEGATLRELSVTGEASAELLGSGDLIRTWQDDDLAGELAEWHVMTGMTVAILDARVTVALSRFPEVWLALLERVEARAQHLAMTQAISQMTGVDARLEALLRHLARRFGRVGSEGVRVPLRLSHRQLGALVGARRPTVSTAVSLLAQQHRVWRCVDGSWMLAHEGALAGAAEPLLGPAVAA